MLFLFNVCILFKNILVESLGVLWVILNITQISLIFLLGNYWVCLITSCIFYRTGLRLRTLILVYNKGFLSALIMMHSFTDYNSLAWQSLSFRSCFLMISLCWIGVFLLGISVFFLWEVILWSFIYWSLYVIYPDGYYFP